jgi:DNA polymerase-3 subunit beta
MKVHVPKKQLADTLSHVERIIPSRSSNPGLSLLKLELVEDRVVLSGSNMDIDIRASLGADVDGSGTYALPAQVFSQVVRALPGELVELEFRDNELHLASDSYATRLQLVSPENAPSLEFPTSFEGQLPARRLTAALGRVRYAAAVAEYQAVFRGVKLELADGHTRSVATDGFRLAYYHFDTASGLDAEIVIPARSVDELVRVIEGGDARLHLSEGQLSISAGDFQMNVKLMEGAFPDYERVIPSSFPVSITAKAADLSDAVARVAVMAEKTANNRVDFFVKDGTLQITAEGPYGRSQEAMEVGQEGSEAEIALAYNARYLVDALSPLDGELRISFSGATSPSLMADLDDPSYLAMVVPLRTG